MDSLPVTTAYAAVAPETQSLLIADDDLVYGGYLSRVFVMEGYNTSTCSSVSELIEAYLGGKFSLIVMDSAFCGIPATELIPRMRGERLDIDTLVVVLQSSFDATLTVDLLNCGADEVLAKSLRHKELLARVKALIRMRSVVYERFKISSQQRIQSLKNRLYERQQELESSVKRNLYRELVFSFTKGRLLVLDSDEFDQYVSDAFTFEEGVDINSLRAVSRARMVVDKELRELQFPDEVIEDINLCVSEAASNVIKHGGGGFMRSAYLQAEDSFCLYFRDHGSGINEAFFANALFCAGASDKKSLGFGFSIILGIMDSVLMTTGSSGTALLLKKRRIAPQVSDHLNEVLERF